jgi:hypothetical protein
VILYHDGVDLNTWFKDSTAMCYLFGALDLVMDALAAFGGALSSTPVACMAP